MTLSGMALVVVGELTFFALVKLLIDHNHQRRWRESTGATRNNKRLGPYR